MAGRAITNNSVSILSFVYHALVITNATVLTSLSKDPSTIERYSDDEEEIEHPPIIENSDESGSMQLTIFFYYGLSM